MKRFLMFSFLFLILFTCVVTVKAYECNYVSGNDTVIFVPSLRTPQARGKFDGKSENKEYIQNWKGNISGDNEYGLHYFMDSLCPEYVVWNKTSHGYNVYIASASSVSNVENILKNSKPKPKDGWPRRLKLTAQHDGKEKIYDNYPTSCLDFPKVAQEGADPRSAEGNSCEGNKYFACMWIDDVPGAAPYCNVDKLLYVKCGDLYDIPMQAPKIISFIINLFKIATPIILIIVSIIDLVKALASSKDDQIKKAQSNFIKKLIAAVLVFLVIYIVQFVITAVADGDDEGNVTNCLSCFMNNDCTSATYYKANVSGKWECRYLSGEPIPCGDELTN